MMPAASAGAMKIDISGTASPPEPCAEPALGDAGQQDREHRDRIERERESRARPSGPAASSSAGAGPGARRRACHAAKASLASTASSTIAPPASVAAPGFSPISSQTHSGPSDRLEQREQAELGRGQVARRGGGEQAAGAELHAAHQREEREIARRWPRTAATSAKRDRQRDDARDHHLRQHVDGGVEACAAP